MKKLIGLFTLALQVGANLVLAAGILFLNWNANDSVAVYFLETLLIGVLNIPLLILCGLYGPSRTGAAHRDLVSSASAERIPLTIKTALLFPVFYGIFFFLQLLAVSMVSSMIRSVEFRLFNGNGIFYIFNNMDLNVYTVLAGMLIVQLIDGVVFLVKKSYRTTNIRVQELAPYKRIIVQQLAVIFGSFLVAFVHKTAFALVIIAFKIAWDISTRISGGDEWALFRRRVKELPGGNPDPQ